MKRFLTIFTCLVASGAFIHVSAQERAVMPDRNSIEISGQISSLKALIESLANTLADVSNSVGTVGTQVSNLADRVVILETNITNVNNTSSTTTTNPGPSPQDALRAIAGRTIQCSMDGHVVYARVTADFHPQTRVVVNGWRDYTSDSGWRDGFSATAEQRHPAGGLNSQYGGDWRKVSASWGTAFDYGSNSYNAQRVSGTAYKGSCSISNPRMGCRSYGESRYTSCTANW